MAVLGSPLPQGRELKLISYNGYFKGTKSPLPQGRELKYIPAHDYRRRQRRPSRRGVN